MTERPLLVSAPMVRAYLDGLKTQTRRLVYRYGASLRCGGEFLRDHPPNLSLRYDRFPALTGWHKVVAGDLLWVRETFTYAPGQTGAAVGRLGAYKASEPDHPARRWWPAIHMPRRFARIELKVTATRIERLQAIDYAGCLAEGFVARPGISRDPAVHHDAARDWYCDLWMSLHHGSASWASNPWVVVITTETVFAGSKPL